MIERILQLWTRLADYDTFDVLVELVAIGAIVYLVYHFLRGTRGARVFQGVGLLFVIVSFTVIVLGGEQQAFPRLRHLYGGFVNVAIIALVVIFQPELRRAMVRLGEAKLFRGAFLPVETVIEEIVAASAYLSKNKIGGLMAIERDVGVGAVAEGGTILNARVSAELLKTIFWPGTALHDMGVVIRGEMILAAGVQFPLSESEEISQELGSRHRAAMGLSQEADCLIIVISEETGAISLAERGVLKRRLTPDELRQMLRQKLLPMSDQSAAPTELPESGEPEAPPESDDEEPDAPAAPSTPEKKSKPAKEPASS